MNKKISSPIAIIIIILIVTILVGGLVVWNYFKCEGKYYLSCKTKEGEIIKEKIPCSDNSNYSFNEIIKSYCGPEAHVQFPLCVGMKYYCSKEGFYMGCRCSFLRSSIDSFIKGILSRSKIR